MSKQPTVLVIGLGAVGTAYGWRIQQGGAKVSVICRSNYSQASNAGIEIKSAIHGEGLFNPDRVFSSCAQSVADGTIYDYVIVCTKSLPNIVDPAEQIKDCILSTKTVIVLAQNGMDIEKPFVRLFPQNPLILTIVYISATYNDDHSVSYSSFIKLEHSIFKKDPLEVSDIDVQTTQDFHQLLLASGIDSIVVNNLNKARWRKLAINASVNPISVLSGGYTSGELLKIKEAHQLMKASILEIVKIAEAVLDEPLYDIPSEQAVDEALGLFANSPNQVPSSTLRDYDNKKPMEHEVIIRNTLNMAKKHKIDVPILETMYALLVMKEAKNI
ncbi:hypothetical protein BB561_001499 [Smittium simulii]|uniref:2-dehydropantoate 2-reductase n=1 Tax=Smittium simulii TaxID=133385 RepID=A0A2T9YUB3_9FUNG|nr:hypothetical protein BB561_001499 [Smittium simulii]